MTASPDKWVRKAIYDRIHNMDVNGETVPCYDVSATDYNGNFYTILSTQNKNDNPTKCVTGWIYSILIDIVSRYRKNTGSRLMADDMENEILTLLDGMTLDVASGMKVSTIRISSEPDLTNNSTAEIVHRKFLRYELTIN